MWLLDHPHKLLVMNNTYTHPGTHTITVPALKRRTHALLLLEMEDERRLAFHDEVALSFHMHSYRLLKWILALPVLVKAAALVARAAGDVAGPELPSFSPARAGHLA